jgi:hypothetical protein
MSRILWLVKSVIGPELDAIWLVVLKDGLTVHVLAYYLETILTLQICSALLRKCLERQQKSRIGLKKTYDRTHQDSDKSLTRAWTRVGSCLCHT